MPKKPSEIDYKAPIKWVPQPEFYGYFESLSADDRWTHPEYSERRTLWHWEQKRWWALEEDS